MADRLGIDEQVIEENIAATKEVTPAMLFVLWVFITLSLWSFAFWHAPEQTPEWLLRAQSACFGTDQTGLPDTYGWFILILAPLSFFFALTVAYGNALGDSLRSFFHSRIRQVLAFALTICVLGETLWVSKRINQGLAIKNETYLSEDLGDLPEAYPMIREPASPFVLTNQNGEHVSLESLRGKPVLLAFAFSHCQTVCPAVVQQTLAAKNHFPPYKLQLVIVTLDPWRDIPSALPSMAARWNLGEGEHILSGSVDEVLAVLQAYRMPIQRDLKTGDITHPSPSYLIDSSGMIVYQFNNPSVTWLVQALDRVIKNKEGT